MDPEKCLAGDLPVPVKPQVNGYGSIETYTVIYSRDQKPSYAVLYGKTEDDFRFIARTRDDPEIFHWLKAGSRVGHRVKIVFDDSLEMNIADFL
jgi:uncharacterized OB-fold protein